MLDLTGFRENDLQGPTGLGGRNLSIFYLHRCCRLTFTEVARIYGVSRGGACRAAGDARVLVRMYAPHWLAVAKPKAGRKRTGRKKKGQYAHRKSLKAVVYLEDDEAYEEDVEYVRRRGGNAVIPTQEEIAQEMRAIRRDAIQERFRLEARQAAAGVRTSYRSESYGRVACRPYRVNLQKDR